MKCQPVLQAANRRNDHLFFAEKILTGGQVAEAGEEGLEDGKQAQRIAAGVVDGCQ